LRNRGEQAGEDTWSKLDMVDLSHNELGFIDRQVFDGPLKAVRYTTVALEKQFEKQFLPMHLDVDDITEN